MGYPIAIWEQIRSTVGWKTRTFVENIKKEIAVDYSIRQFHGIYPVPWQLGEVLKQRADNWVQRLYDPCCDAHKASGNNELSLEFDLAIWAYWIEPFITREVQTTEEGYRASQLLELLLCAAGSTPENRRALKVGQKDCCLAVRNEVNQDWSYKSGLPERCLPVPRESHFEIPNRKAEHALPTQVKRQCLDPSGRDQHTMHRVLRALTYSGPALERSWQNPESLHFQSQR